MVVTLSFYDERIIAATEAHAVVFAAIHAECFAPGERWDASAMAVQLRLPGTFGLLDPAGGMVLARVTADQAEILTIAVVPRLRAQGRAERLLRAAAARADAAGARELFLEVATGNLAARALYARAGFVEVGRRRQYYRDGGDALILRVPLNPAAAAGG